MSEEQTQTTQQAAPAAGDQQAPASTATVVTLRKPIEFEGRTIDRITLDFDRLTGRVMRDAERAFLRGGGIPLPGSGMVSADYCAHVAGMIANVPYECIEQLGAQDYTEVASAVQVFLIGGDIPGETLPAKPAGSA